MKLFGKDYSKYQVIQKDSYSRCGDVLYSYYYIQYNRYFMGISYWSDWGEYRGGGGGSVWCLKQSRSKDEIVKEYKEWVTKYMNAHPVKNSFKVIDSGECKLCECVEK